MKSKQRFFNGAAFRKNLTRFAPAWGLYTLCLMMGLVLLCESGVEYHLSDNLCECIQIMAPINLIYAPICVQLLFGDLYNSRMCNALHAMPIRREGWFAVNVVSGLFFSLVPTAIMTAAALGLSAFSIVTNAWQLPLLWWLGTNLEFICFFGIALFSAFCAGNRLSMGVVYGILNFLAMLVFWILDSIYTPMLYGIEVFQDQFLPYTPVAQMIDAVCVDCQRIYADAETRTTVIGAYFTMGDGWRYLAVYAAVGVVFAVAALLLYRRRKLECAGDFIAIQALEPVFQVLFTVTAAVVVQLVWYEITYDDTYVFLFVGIIAGYFVGRMLIERTPRVFRLKNWLGLTMLAVAIAASLALTALDLLGAVTWVPKAEDVQKVEVVLSSYFNPESDYYVCLEEKDDIANMIFVHERALQERENFDKTIPMEAAATVETTAAGLPVAAENVQVVEVEYQMAESIILRYTLEDGSVRTRYLDVWTHEAEGQLVKNYFSSLQCVLGVEDLTSLVERVDGEVRLEKRVDGIWLGGRLIPQELWSQEDIGSLLQAIEEDAAAGNLVQRLYFHDHVLSIGEADGYRIDSLRLEFHMGDEMYELKVYADSENTLRWLNDHGMISYIIAEEYLKYG